VRTIDLLPAEQQGDFASGEILFLGTATVLLRYAGFTILTDPNFLHRGDHAKLGYGLRSRRLTNPALSIQELPPLDFIVLSHHHGDHFDEIAARLLDKKILIVTTGHAARKLRRQGFQAAVALRTWGSQTVVRGNGKVVITSLPGQHAPRPLVWLLPPVMGSMLEFTRGDDTLVRMYISGDTLVHDDLHEIPRRYPDIDLALLHLGGTKVFGVMLTMDGSQGVSALQIVRPRHAIPIHYNDYTVFKSPLDDFKRALAGASLDTAIHYLQHGESYSFTVPTG
jgi:L-ascorbate metabolism protein UlaG (beta-lactamase superfamily)